MTHIYKWGKSVRAFSDISDTLEASMTGDTELETLASILNDECIFYGNLKENLVQRRNKKVTICDPVKLYDYNPDRLVVLAGPDNDDYNRTIISYLLDRPHIKVLWIVTDTRFKNPPKWLSNVEVYSHIQGDRDMCDFTFRHADINYANYGINRSRIAIVANQVTDTVVDSRWDKIVKLAESFKHTHIDLIGKWNSSCLYNPKIHFIGGLSPSDMFKKLKEYTVGVYLDNDKDRPNDLVSTPKLFEMIMSGLIVFTDKNSTELQSKFTRLCDIEDYLKNLTGNKLIQDRMYQIIRLNVVLEYHKKDLVKAIKGL